MNMMRTAVIQPWWQLPFGEHDSIWMPTACQRACCGSLEGMYFPEGAVELVRRGAAASRTPRTT